MMKQLLFLVVMGLVSIVGTAWGSPAELPDLFFTLSVSTSGASVETRINGVLETFLSGGLEGSLASSVPINLRLKEGTNKVRFTVSPVVREADESGSVDFVAILEIHRRGEIVDTRLPGEHLIFERKLSDEEMTALKEGNVIVIDQSFTVNRQDLDAAMPR